MDEKELNNRFTYHEPKGNQADKYTEIRHRAKVFAEFLNATCPNSAELETAIREVEAAVFWANAAIARNE